MSWQAAISGLVERPSRLQYAVTKPFTGDQLLIGALRMYDCRRVIADRNNSKQVPEISTAYARF